MTGSHPLTVIDSKAGSPTTRSTEGRGRTRRGIKLVIIIAVITTTTELETGRIYCGGTFTPAFDVTGTGIRHTRQFIADFLRGFRTSIPTHDDFTQESPQATTQRLHRQFRQARGFQECLGCSLPITGCQATHIVHFLYVLTQRGHTGGHQFHHTTEVPLGDTEVIGFCPLHHDILLYSRLG